MGVAFQPIAAGYVCLADTADMALSSRYKDNPFTVGDGFGSRWDTEGGTASFTSSWALEKDEPKEEVTISSIQPIGER